MLQCSVRLHRDDVTTVLAGESFFRQEAEEKRDGLTNEG